MAYNDESELITQVRRLINEPSALMHSDTDIVSYINRAAEDIGRKGLLIEKYEATTLATSQATYAFSVVKAAGTTDGIVDAVKVDAMFYWAGGNFDNKYLASSGYALIKSHPRQTGHNSTGTEGPPIEWWVENEELHIWPPPSSSEVGHFIQVLYHEKPDTYNEGSGIPPYLRELVLWYATAKCFEKEGKYGHHEQYMSIYNNFLAFFRANRMLSKIPDSKDMMQTPDRTQYTGE